MCLFSLFFIQQKCHAVRDSPYVEESIGFLQWLQGDEVLDAYSAELSGFFSMREDAPPPNNPYAREFINADDEMVNIGLWFMPEGLPSGYSLMDQSLRPLIDGETTPEAAAAAVQEGLRRWYAPAQACEGLGDLIASSD